MSDVKDLMIDGPAGRLSVRTKGMSAKPANVVILTQGANMTGQMGYDFAFEGGSDYSMMDAFLAAGFGVLTFSIRGYGLSELSGDPFLVQTDEAIEDLAAVVDWVNEQGYHKPHLLGWSWGGRITARYVSDNPGRIDRLILLDPALGGGNKILPAPSDALWSNTYEYFFNKLEVDLTAFAAREALGRRMEAEEPTSPNGIRLENANGSQASDPSKVECPTLMIYGIEAGNQNYMQGGWDRLKFYEALPNADKSFVLVPGGGDYAHLQHGRHRIFRSSVEFLTAV